MKLLFTKCWVSVVLAVSVLPAVSQGDAGARSAAPARVVVAAVDARDSAAARAPAPARHAHEQAQSPAQSVGEPSTYALMLAGLALIGLMLLRRRHG